MVRIKLVSNRIEPSQVLDGRLTGLNLNCRVQSTTINGLRPIKLFPYGPTGHGSKGKLTAEIRTIISSAYETLAGQSNLTLLPQGDNHGLLTCGTTPTEDSDMILPW